MTSILLHVLVFHPLEWLRLSLAWISSLPMGLGSVYDFETIACPSVSSLGAIAMEFGMDIIVTYGTFSIIYILVTTDVVGDNWCGCSGLWPFRSEAISVCGRSGLWLFRFVAVPVCGHFGLWPFRFVAFSVCGRFGLCPFRLWPFRCVAVMTCYHLNKANLRDLKAATGLVILLKVDSNHLFFRPCDLEIWRMT